MYVIGTAYVISMCLQCVAHALRSATDEFCPTWNDITQRKYMPLNKV